FSAVPRFLGLIAGWLFLLSLYQFFPDREHRRQVLLLVLLSVGIEAAFGLVQYYLLTPGNWLGYDAKQNLPYGIFQQPNVMATFMTTGVTLSLYLLLDLHGAEQKWYKSTLCYSVAFAASLVTLKLGSRTGLLTLLAGPAILTLFFFKEKKQILVQWWLVLICAFLVGGAVPPLETGLQKTSQEISHGSPRLAIYRECLSMIWERPWLGWGYGDFPYQYLHHYSVSLKEGRAVPGSPENLLHPHNELLFWWVEGGIAPVLGIGLTIWAWLKNVSSRGWKQGGELSVLFLPIWTHLMLEYPFYHSLAHWVVFLVLLWWVDEECGSLAAKEFRYGFALRTLAIILSGITVVFMITTLRTTSLVVRYEKSKTIEHLRDLGQVVNPGPWGMQIQAYGMINRFAQALMEKDRAGIESYLSWAAKAARQRPNRKLYATMAEGYAALGEKEKMNELIEQMKEYYPLPHGQKGQS
nr:Wzy polymerase domain-containing protein [Desulfobacteraceae bacterium]